MKVGSDHYDRWVLGFSIDKSVLLCQMSCTGTFVRSSLVLESSFLSAKPGVSIFTSMGLIVMSFRICRTIFSFGSASIHNRKSDAVLSFLGLCAVTKLNCNTQLHAFQCDDGIIFVWKNLVTDLLSVLIMVGLVAPRKMVQLF